MRTEVTEAKHASPASIGGAEGSDSRLLAGLWCPGESKYMNVPLPSFLPTRPCLASSSSCRASVAHGYHARGRHLRSRDPTRRQCCNLSCRAMAVPPQVVLVLLMSR
eukprot:764529-Hanusia_phi.AAC.12